MARPTGPALGDAVRVVKRPLPVPVAFASADGACDTREGRVRYRAGDAIVTGVQGERWPVGRAAFLASYTPAPPTQAGEDGAYIKTPVVTLARKARRRLTVTAGGQRDTLTAAAGDWVLFYPDGTKGVIAESILHETYMPATPGEPWPPAP